MSFFPAASRAVCLSRVHGFGIMDALIFLLVIKSRLGRRLHRAPMDYELLHPPLCLLLYPLAWAPAFPGWQCRISQPLPLLHFVHHCAAQHKRSTHI